ncbi:MAG: helix-turn-helix domain-containing protein [Desulfobacterota bacterium]|jgi:DNA-binding transcriptional regulator YiaG|nr:helix-turn-helix domain-containing protein [Thermodesulfobacteriota bacterium]
MAKLAEVLRGEIIRISRREARMATAGIREAKIKLTKTVADLKRKIAKLQGENKWLVAAEKKRLAQKPQVAPEESKKARLTAKGIRRLRKKLGVSQANFAKLLGASTQTVHMWETKEGPLRLRGNTLAAVVSARDLGAREAKRRIAELRATTPARKAVRRKRAKRR